MDDTIKTLSKIAYDLDKLLHDHKSPPHKFRVAICLDKDTFDRLHARVEYGLRNAMMVRAHDGRRWRQFTFAGVTYLSVEDGAALDDPYLSDRAIRAGEASE